MKFFKISQFLSVGLIICFPTIIAMQSGGAQSTQASTQPSLVALEIPNHKKGDLARVLAQFAKTIDQKLQQLFKQAGLKFIPLKASQIHLSLFDAPLTNNDLHALATATQNAVRAMGSSNTFHPLTLGSANRMSNSIVISLAGQGNNMMAQAAQIINQAMGNTSLPYSGHISIGRIKLLSQKSGQPTTQTDKDKIDQIMQANPQLIQAIIAIPLPPITPFYLNKIYINHGGGSDAKQLASMDVATIKQNVGTPQSLVKEVDRKK